MEQQAVELILLRQWASYVAVPIVLLDVKGQLLFYNEAAEAIIGQNFEDSGAPDIAQMNRSLQVRTEEGERIRASEHPLALALFEGRPVHRRLRMRSMDGTWRLLEATAVPILAQGQRRLGAFAMFWEVPSP